jgi:hypothetical protein
MPVSLSLAEPCGKRESEIKPHNCVWMFLGVIDDPLRDLRAVKSVLELDEVLVYNHSSPDRLRGTLGLSRPVDGDHTRHVRAALVESTLTVLTKVDMSPTAPESGPHT